jgi:hypothetical protein
LRELEIMKANYGPIGEIVPLVWRNGVFVLEDLGIDPADRKAIELSIEQQFLQLLDVFTEQRRIVSDKNKANNYAPTMFAGVPGEPNMPRRSSRDYKLAMERLFLKGKIKVEIYGREDRDQHKLVRG